jgi:cytochrome c oxidase subunit 2
VTRPTRRFGALLGLVALTSAGCLPTPATDEGRATADLYRVFFAGGVIVAGIVWVLATVAMLRFRRRDDRLPDQVHGNQRLELVWTAVPLLTVLVLFALTYVTLQTVDATSPQPGVRIHVTAFRWQWQFDYTDDGVSIVGLPGTQPEMVVPVGEPIHITLDAADVIHAFSVPQFLFKRDAIPGHTNTFDFLVNTPGTYPGYCAEFCGVQHAQMLFNVRGVSPADYDQWLATQRAASPSAAASP